MMEFKKWLCNKFLPAWCRDDLIECNKKLQEKASMLMQENQCLQAYIDGMEYAINGRRSSEHNKRIV